MSREDSPLVVVMGVSGAGKTTVGRLIARRMKAEFLEGDDLHPPRNVERMSSGIALTDVDRREWLLAIAHQLADARASRHALVVSCSALKREYRDMLRAASTGIAFVHLTAEPALLATRLRERPRRFMSPALLASQLKTLEPPVADERAAAFDTARPAEEVAAQAAAWIAALPPAPPQRRS